MSEKFLITHENETYELEYSDLNTKKLSKICRLESNKPLQYTSYILLLILGLVVIYDFFKDIARKTSSLKDLFNNKGDYSKFIGFTKDNMTRTIIKIVLAIVAYVLYLLSFSLAKRVDCLTSTSHLLIYSNEIIQYDNQGKPVGIMVPKKITR